MGTLLGWKRVRCMPLRPSDPQVEDLLSRYLAPTSPPSSPVLLASLWSPHLGFGVLSLHERLPRSSRDWRRVNVAMTRSAAIIDRQHFSFSLIDRARYKIVFVGSLAMMDQVEILRQLANLCQSRFALPPSPPSSLQKISTCAGIRS
jgi:hypothetical protein